MSNPYLLEVASRLRTDKKAISLTAELKRVAGSPLRLLTTITLMLLPLLLTLAGGLDWLGSQLYALSHRGASDHRKAVFFMHCLLDNTHQLCRGIVIGGVGGTKKVEFSFLHQMAFLQKWEPLIYYLLLVTAWLAFVSIGNPRLRRIGITLRQVLLPLVVKDSSGLEEETNTVIPAPNPDPTRNWLIGGRVKRSWESDPGYFFLEEAFDTNKGKSKQVNPKLLKGKSYFLSTDILRTNLL